MSSLAGKRSGLGALPPVRDRRLDLQNPKILVIPSRSQLRSRGKSVRGICCLHGPSEKNFPQLEIAPNDADGACRTVELRSTGRTRASAPTWLLLISRIVPLPAS